MRPEFLKVCCLSALLAGCAGDVFGGGGSGGGAQASTGGGGSAGGTQAATGGGSSVATGGGSSSGTGGGTGAGGGDAFATSGKAALRFKRNVRLTNDFAAALGLPVATLCTELGQYSCTEYVHTLALEGTDPYGTGLYQPLAYTGATTPLVVDRVALAGCGQRVALDVATPATALIYAGLTVTADGKLDPTQPAVTQVLNTLYQRALLRMPTPAEVAAQQQLYRDIEAQGQPQPAQSWMTLSCFAVMTSVESIFY